MYFRSVRFYKCLIYSGLTLVVLFAGIGIVRVVRWMMPAVYAVEEPPVLPQEAPPLEQLAPVEMPAYTQLYPELYVSSAELVHTQGKVAYLTFDDGPSHNTSEILDILEEYQVPATFFVVTGKNRDLSVLERMVADGHSIGIHSDLHEYRTIYASTEDFLADFAAAHARIEEACGVRPEIFRFPGGSINSYNTGSYQETASEMLRRGFRYFDWNVSLEDAKSGITAQEIYANMVRDINTYQCDRAVILAHDGAHHRQLVVALPNIIEYLMDEGYTFARLDSSVQPVVFSYPV